MPSRLLSSLVVLTCAAAFAQAPRIDRVSPGEGPISGGTVAVVSGAHLAGAAVTIDQIAVAPLSRSDSEIRLVMPPHENGYASIALRSGAGTAYGEFLYVPPALGSLPSGFITTIAGIGNFSGNYRPATRAVLTPGGIAYHGESLFVADTPGDRVLRVREDGILEPFAGNGRTFGPRPNVPTPALEVSIAFPRGIAVDADGNVYVPDTNSHIWRMTPSGIAQIIAGTGTEGFSGDGGPAVAAQIGHPNHIAVDHAGNVFFIDWTNVRIRKIDSSGTISTIAGSGTRGFSGDGGPATAAQFDLPTPDEGGLAADGSGNLFLLDFANRRIRRIDGASGIVETVVGPDADGRPLSELRGVAVAGDGTLYFTNASVVFRRSPDGGITRLSGEDRGFSPDGTMLIDARLEGAGMLAISPDGELTFSEAGVGRVRKVDSSGRIVTIAGSGPGRLNEGGPAHSGIIVGTNVDLDFLTTRELIFGEDDRLRKIDAAGNIQTIAGVRSVAPAEGVPELPFGPMGIDAGAADGIIHVAGWSGVLAVDPSGSWEIVAGSVQPDCSLTGDGAIATTATFCQAWDVARDTTGNLFIADTNNNRVRRVDAHTGIITTIAGTGPPNGYEGYGNGQTCGDGGPAIDACLDTPYGVAVDNDGNVYIAHVDTNGRIRKVSATGSITTLAELPATKLEMLGPVAYAVSGDRVVRIDPDGSQRIIAGGNGIGFSGDGGLATNAKMYAQKQSHGVAIDGEGNIFFSDGDNRRIRAVRHGAVLAPPGARVQTKIVGSAIDATVLDAAMRPLPSVRVEFTSPSAGPSCRFANGAASMSAITGPDGVATARCTPNCIAGAYTIYVRATSGPPASTHAVTNNECGRRRSVRH